MSLKDASDIKDIWKKSFENADERRNGLKRTGSLPVSGFREEERTKEAERLRLNGRTEVIDTKGRKSRVTQVDLDIDQLQLHHIPTGFCAEPPSLERPRSASPACRVKLVSSSSESSLDEFPGHSSVASTTPELPLPPKAGSYQLGERVECRDRGGVWKQGVVTSLTPLEVLTDESPQAYIWDEVRKQGQKKAVCLLDKVPDEVPVVSIATDGDEGEAKDHRKSVSQAAYWGRATTVEVAWDIVKGFREAFTPKSTPKSDTEKEIFIGTDDEEELEAEPIRLQMPEPVGNHPSDSEQRSEREAPPSSSSRGGSKSPRTSPRSARYESEEAGKTRKLKAPLDGALPMPPPADGAAPLGFRSHPRTRTRMQSKPKPSRGNQKPASWFERLELVMCCRSKGR